MHDTKDYIIPTRSLSESQSIKSALQVLMEEHSSGLPVTDSTGKLLGFFSTYKLIALLLPRAMTISPLGLRDLSFVADSLGHIREKMSEIANDKVGAHMYTPDYQVYPDTPITELMLLLHREENRLPVADRATGKLVGIVSATGLLELIGKDS